MALGSRAYRAETDALKLTCIDILHACGPEPHHENNRFSPSAFEGLTAWMSGTSIVNLQKYHAVILDVPFAMFACLLSDFSSLHICSGGLRPALAALAASVAASVGLPRSKRKYYRDSFRGNTVLADYLPLVS